MRTTSPNVDTTTPWRELGACRGVDTTLFFPGQGESVAEAKAICASCIVRAECADYALATGQRFGIWGGTTERDRRRLRAQLRQLDAA
ncbi:MAG: WhiB family transcriptional regulator [Actinomycetota bacterium]